MRYPGAEMFGNPPDLVLCQGCAIAVIDLDSPPPGRFDKEDAAGLELLARLAAEAI